MVALASGRSLLASRDYHIHRGARTSDETTAAAKTIATATAVASTDTGSTTTTAAPQSTTVNTTTLPATDEGFLVAMTNLMAKLDERVEKVQKHLDTSVQKVFRSEIMAQNNRLNLTGELEHIVDTNNMVNENARHFSEVTEFDARTNITINTNEAGVKDTQQRVEKDHALVDSLIGEDGLFSPEANADRASKIETLENKVATWMSPILPDMYARAVQDNETEAEFEARLQAKVEEAMRPTMRENIQRLNDRVRRLVKTHAPPDMYSR